MARTAPIPRPRAASITPRIVVYVLLLLLSTVMIFPFLWMLFSSFKPYQEIFAGKSFLPQNPTLNNYVSLFAQADA